MAPTKERHGNVAFKTLHFMHLRHHIGGMAVPIFTDSVREMLISLGSDSYDLISTSTSALCDN